MNSMDNGFEAELVPTAKLDQTIVAELTAADTDIIDSSLITPAQEPTNQEKWELLRQHEVDGEPVEMTPAAMVILICLDTVEPNEPETDKLFPDNKSGIYKPLETITALNKKYTKPALELLEKQGILTLDNYKQKTGNTVLVTNISKTPRVAKIVKELGAEYTGQGFIPEDFGDSIRELLIDRIGEINYLANEHGLADQRASELIISGDQIGDEPTAETIAEDLARFLPDMKQVALLNLGDIPDLNKAASHIIELLIDSHDKKLRIIRDMEPESTKQYRQAAAGKFLKTFMES